jgi:hypothetical protein
MVCVDPAEAALANPKVAIDMLDATIAMIEARSFARRDLRQCLVVIGEFISYPHFLSYVCCLLFAD